MAQFSLYRLASSTLKQWSSVECEFKRIFRLIRTKFFTVRTWRSKEIESNWPIWTSVSIDFLQLVGKNPTFTFVILARQTERSIHIDLSSESIPLPKLSTKFSENSINSSSNIFYLSFSPGLTCRYSSSSTVSTCFYYLSSINFTQLEYHYDRILKNSLASSMRSRSYFIVIYSILALLILGTCVLALYLLCTNRLSSDHTIRLDYIVDPQLAREAALKLGPEPVG